LLAWRRVAGEHGALGTVSFLGFAPAPVGDDARHALLFLAMLGAPTRMTINCRTTSGPLADAHAVHYQPPTRTVTAIMHIAITNRIIMT
jgi:hypothetical protein